MKRVRVTREGATVHLPCADRAVLRWRGGAVELAVEGGMAAIEPSSLWGLPPGETATLLIDGATIALDVLPHPRA